MKLFADVFPGQKEEDIYWNAWTGNKIGWEKPPEAKRIWIEVFVDINALFPLRGEYLGSKTAMKQTTGAEGGDE